jgi:hypothetical protein
MRNQYQYSGLPLQDTYEKIDPFQAARVSKHSSCGWGSTPASATPIRYRTANYEIRSSATSHSPSLSFSLVILLNIFMSYRFKFRCKYRLGKGPSLAVFVGHQRDAPCSCATNHLIKFIVTLISVPHDVPSKIIAVHYRSPCFSKLRTVHLQGEHTMKFLLAAELT